MHARRARPTGREAHPVRHPVRAASGTPRRRASRAAGQRRGRIPDDLRRAAAALASATVPGLGQLLNGRRRLARWFAVPALLLLTVVVVVVATRSPARLFAAIVSPTAMAALLALNVVLLGWRLAAVAHAFFDRRYPARSGRAGAAGLVLALAAVVVPHGLANAWGTSAQATFAHVFGGDRDAGPGQLVAASRPEPGPDDRLTILLVGIDAAAPGATPMTDAMVVVSVDPVGASVTVLSLPPDLARVPLADGNVFGPKLSSLMAYADRHPEDFPEGGLRALQGAVGALLGIEVHYGARLDYRGFVELVDALGGLDVDVARGFQAPSYDGLGINPDGVQGWAVAAGPNHFDGWEALAYARVRLAPGEDEVTRAGRQQAILLALRDRLGTEGSLLWSLPGLVTAFGDLVTTNLPTARLPDLAAIVEEMDPDAVVGAVLQAPLVVAGGSDPVAGTTLVPDHAAILAVAKMLFPEPGVAPQPWPAPRPTGPG